VCVRCGKHGDGVPLVDAGPTAYAAPARAWTVPQAAIEDEDVEDLQPPVSADPPTGWTASMSDDELGDVVHAADVARPPAAGPGDETGLEPHDRRSPLTLTPTLATVAVVSLAVAGGAAYLAFRRRRRHR
jgi:hypothetical protein